MPETTNHVGGKGEGAGSGPQTTPTLPTKPIQWRKAEPRQSFCDGDQILVACPYTNRHSGKTTYEYSILTVSCDSENFGFDCYGSSWDGEWEEVEWWIPLSEFRVPTLMVDAATARAEVHRLRKCLDVAQLAMVAVVQYANSLGPCDVRERLLEIAKTRPADPPAVRCFYGGDCLWVWTAATGTAWAIFPQVLSDEWEETILPLANLVGVEPEIDFPTALALLADRPEQQARLRSMNEHQPQTKGT